MQPSRKFTKKLLWMKDEFLLWRKKSWQLLLAPKMMSSIFFSLHYVLTKDNKFSLIERKDVFDCPQHSSSSCVSMNSANLILYLWKFMMISFAALMSLMFLSLFSVILLQHTSLSYSSFFVPSDPYIVRGGSSGSRLIEFTLLVLNARASPLSYVFRNEFPHSINGQ